MSRSTAAVLTVGQPDASMSLVWATAKAFFEVRRAAEVAHDQAIWMPAYHASNLPGGPKIPEDIDDEAAWLTEIRCDAEDALMLTMAPDLSAVIWKMEYANKRWEGFCDWPNDWWDTVISDLQRFAGGAA